MEKKTEKRRGSGLLVLDGGGASSLGGWEGDRLEGTPQPEQNHPRVWKSQAWKPEMHIARRLREFGQSGFLAALGLFFSARERRPQHGFFPSVLSRRLNGVAPHPSAGPRTGAASEAGCTLLSYKTVPPFSLPFLLLTANRERWSGIWPTGSLVLALNTTLLQAHLPSPSWHRMK